MTRPDGGQQGKREFIRIEEMAPDDHLLRKIDTYMDFGCVKERLYPVYCPDNGRSAVDPVVLFKMLFIGYLYWIRSARQLGRDIEANVAYRWFSGAGLGDTVPHASPISQNRRRRFDGTDVFRELFEDVVVLAIRQGFVDGKGLYRDSTLLKANTNTHRWKRTRATTPPTSATDIPHQLPHVPLCGRITPPRGLLLLQISPRLPDNKQTAPHKRPFVSSLTKKGGFSPALFLSGLSCGRVILLRPSSPHHAGRCCPTLYAIAWPRAMTVPSCAVTSSR